jgi:hypothetical protein
MTDHCFGFRKLNTCTGARAQAGVLLTNQIAPGKRTLAPSRCAASASRPDSMGACGDLRWLAV